MHTHIESIIYQVLADVRKHVHASQNILNVIEHIRLHNTLQQTRLKAWNVTYEVNVSLVAHVSFGLLTSWQF
jgi:hypothetical protein